MKILVVEDEPKVASFIKRGLDENGYEAVVAYDGVIGLRMLRQEEFKLIILDVNMPGKNGFEVAREIRSFNRSIPILMLTALGSTDDKVEGFDSGADDYLVKPFEFVELLARIRALSKRSQMEDMSRIIAVADLEMNLDTKTVKRSGAEVHLTAKEFSLLEFMMRNKGRVVSKAEIASKVWDVNFETGTNVIEVYVNFLRKKIDRDTENKLIQTKIGMGYILRDAR